MMIQQTHIDIIHKQIQKLRTQIQILHTQKEILHYKKWYTDSEIVHTHTHIET